MAESNRLRLGLAALVVGAFLVFAYLNGPASLEPGEARPERVVAAAIDRFSVEFSGQVPEAERVVIPASLDRSAISVWLESERQLVDKVVSGETFWEVGRVSEVGDYWVVEMQSSGESFFAGEIFFQVDPEGEVYRVSPAEVGVSPTTAVSSS